MQPATDSSQHHYRLYGQFEQQELSFLLAPGENQIGGAEDNDLVVSVSGTSRHHARLSHDAGDLTLEGGLTLEGCLMLEDLGSRNGTFVNGRRIGRAEVRPGDVLRFGLVELRLEEIDAGDAKMGIVLRMPEVAQDPDPPSDQSDSSTVSLGDLASAEPVRPGSRLVFPDGYVKGRSLALKRLYDAMLPLLTSDLPVLIEGETGVGKEVVARVLHLSSSRRDGPFVAVNCAAIPAELMESEMFGIADAVATGVRKRLGTFRAAAAGTLFLDEIGEMAPQLQVKLLRALQEKEVQPVGGPAEAVDVRVLAATNVDLLQRANEERFRRDLYYRVAGSVLRIPPLRDRPEDVALLVESFLGRFAVQSDKRIQGMTVKALRVLEEFSWPGNVRQLEHEILRLVHLCGEGQAIDSTMLSIPEPSSSEQMPAGAEPSAGRLAEDSPAELAFEARVRQLESEMITEALNRTRGVRRQAAKLLGISRNRLTRKIEELGLDDIQE